MISQIIKMKTQILHTKSYNYGMHIQLIDTPMRYGCINIGAHWPSAHQEMLPSAIMKIQSAFNLVYFFLLAWSTNMSMNIAINVIARRITKKIMHLISPVFTCIFFSCCQLLTAARSGKNNHILRIINCYTSAELYQHHNLRKL